MLAKLDQSLLNAEQTRLAYMAAENQVAISQSSARALAGCGAQSSASVQAALDGVWLQGLPSDQKCPIYKAKQWLGGGKQRFLKVAGEKL